MGEVASVLAVGAVAVGLLLAVAHLAGVGLLTRRRASPRPDLVPWGPLGAGLAAAAAGFVLARGATGDWGAVEDLTGLATVLAVSAWGFGAAREWATTRFGRGVPWWTPLACSAVTGALVGLAATSLGV